MARKQRIFFDATPLVNEYISGIGKVLIETLRALDNEYFNEKYDMYVFVPFNESKKMERFSFRYIKVKSLPYPHKVHSLFSRLKFGPPIDLFLGRGIYVFENYRNWNLIFSKSVTYIHDIAFKVYPEYIEEANLRYLNKYINIWKLRTDRIITVSESSKREIEQSLSVKDVAIVLNASDPEMYPRSLREVERARNKWGIPKNYFIYFGNIEPRKNLVNTIKAFSLYVSNPGSDDALVLIGGDGWRNEEIYREIEIAKGAGVNIIKPPKFVPDEDMPALLTGARALLQISWHEGFGMSVLHALACGTPVVASDIPALHEAAGRNEKSVVFVDPSDAMNIAEGIKKVTSIDHIKNPHSIQKWSDSVRSLEKIIDSL